MMLVVELALHLIGAPPAELNDILCDTPEQAMRFAAAKASGQTWPMAVDAVNKAEGHQVCGRYIGKHRSLREQTETFDGQVFIVHAVAFEDDPEIRWSASIMSAFNSDSLGRRA